MRSRCLPRTSSLTQRTCLSRTITAAAGTRFTALGEFEILTTGPKWYDTRARAGGGGAIDLAMHVLGLSFVDAVKRLTTR